MIERSENHKELKEMIGLALAQQEDRLSTILDSRLVEISKKTRRELAANLLTPDQAADYLAIKPQTLAVWRSAGGQGPEHIRVGSAIRYHRDALAKYIQQRTVKN